MNNNLENMLGAADRELAEHGETQAANVGYQDRRAETSPANGQKGGRPFVDHVQVARDYIARTGRVVKFCDGELYEYDPERGAYDLLSNKERLHVSVGNFLANANIPGVRYSTHTEKEVAGALRGLGLTYKRDVFLDTGESTAGWAALKNGLLNIEAAARGEQDVLRPYTPDFFSTTHFPHVWDPNATCPRFQEFIAQLLPDEDAREMAQMIFGLLLVKDHSYNVIFYYFGEGGTGKSALLAIHRGILGEANTSAVPPRKWTEKHSIHQMAHSLANLVDDSPTVDGRFGGLAVLEGVMKEVAEGQKMEVEPKGVNPYQASITARCIFCQNPPLPRVLDKSEGLWDRMRIIPFNVRFRGTDKQNKNIAKELLAAESPGIFKWCVEGLGKLRRNYPRTFPQCAAGAALLAKHRGTCDRERIFLEDNYHYAPGQFVPSSEIYLAYRAFCEGDGGQPKSKPFFAGEVERVFHGAQNVNIMWDGRKQRGFKNIAPGGNAI